MRGLRRLLVVVVVLAVLFVVADRVTVRIAQGEIERRVSSDVGASMHADIHGFPFLTQAGRRDLSHVTLHGDLLRVGSGTGVRDVTADLRHVDISDFQRPVAGDLRIDGLLPFADIERRLSLPAGSLHPAGAGQVRLTRQVVLPSGSGTATVVARVSAAGKDIELVASSVTVDGSPVPLALLAGVTGGTSLRYQASGLPAGVQIDAVSVTPGGFRVRITGRGIPLV